MKIVADKLLKMLPCEVAKYYGSHLEKKKSLTDFVTLHTFLSNGGLNLAKLPECFLVIYWAKTHV